MMENMEMVDRVIVSVTKAPLHIQLMNKIQDFLPFLKDFEITPLFIVFIIIAVFILFKANSNYSKQGGIQCEK